MSSIRRLLQYGGCLVLALTTFALLRPSTGPDPVATSLAPSTPSPQWTPQPTSTRAPVDAPSVNGSAWLVAVYNHREHPSCTAEAILRRNAFAQSTSFNAGGAIDAALEPFSKFQGKEKWNCYKHGGHYKPGYNRRVTLPTLPPLVARELTPANLRNTTVEVFVKAPLLEASVKYHQSQQLQFPAPVRYVLKNVAWHQGKLWSCDFAYLKRTFGTDPERRTVVQLPLAGVFSMVAGNWPQTVATKSLDIVKPPKAWRAAMCNGSRPPEGMRVVDVGYWQLETDYISVYHVYVEVILNAFYAFWFEALANGGAAKARSSVVFTSRPTYSRYGFKDNSCRHGASACLNGVWASMMRLVTAWASKAPISEQGIPPGQLQDAATDWIIGLRGEGAEAARPPVFLKEALIGYPTQCEPLWGPDAIVFDRASQLGLRTLPSNVDYRVCQSALWSFRTMLFAASKIDPAASVAAKTTTPHVAWVSRKGDWARWVTNETHIIEVLEAHLVAKYGAKSSRYVTFLSLKSGTLDDQVRRTNAHATVFITNHGANLIPMLYLRVNAAVITLDVDTPGFLPFTSMPSWLHWRRQTITRVCNERLFPKKCPRYLSSSNNDDNVVDDEQTRRLLGALDQVLQAQASHPRTPPPSPESL